jgi:hypothetical protein
MNSIQSPQYLKHPGSSQGYSHFKNLNPINISLSSEFATQSQFHPVNRDSTHFAGTTPSRSIFQQSQDLEKLSLSLQEQEKAIEQEIANRKLPQQMGHLAHKIVSPFHSKADEVGQLTEKMVNVLLYSDPELAYQVLAPQKEKIKALKTQIQLDTRTVELLQSKVTEVSNLALLKPQYPSLSSSHQDFPMDSILSPEIIQKLVTFEEEPCQEVQQAQKELISHLIHFPKTFSYLKTQFETANPGLPLPPSIQSAYQEKLFALKEGSQGSQTTESKINALSQLLALEKELNPTLTMSQSIYPLRIHDPEDEIKHLALSAMVEEPVIRPPQYLEYLELHLLHSQGPLQLAALDGIYKNAEEAISGSAVALTSWAVDSKLDQISKAPQTETNKALQDLAMLALRVISKRKELGVFHAPQVSTPKIEENETTSGFSLQNELQTLTQRYKMSLLKLQSTSPGLVLYLPGGSQEKQKYVTQFLAEQCLPASKDTSANNTVEIDLRQFENAEEFDEFLNAQGPLTGKMIVFTHFDAAQSQSVFSRLKLIAGLGESLPDVSLKNSIVVFSAAQEVSQLPAFKKGNGPALMSRIKSYSAILNLNQDLG